jgi:glyoxylase-like metal-dependent hydrolase (beta-lactamase superfamily II)
VELREVAPHVYACLVPDRGWGWSNAGCVDAGGGLMVDTFMDVARTRRALALLADACGREPARLVNTHHNIDHCWGNQLFRGREILGHRRCAEAMGRDLRPEALEAMRRREDLPPGLRWFLDDVREFDFTGIEPTPPSRLLDADLELDLGTTRARLLCVGPAHTAGDLLVHLPEEGVVFAGDVVFRRCTPIGWEGTTANWLAALDRIVALAPAVVVPGHGPLCGVEGVKELRAYFEHVAAEAGRSFAQGVPLEEAARRIDLGPYAGWTQPERVVFNVARVYRELRGGAWDEPVDAAALLDVAVALRAARGG